MCFGTGKAQMLTHVISLLDTNNLMSAVENHTPNRYQLA